jgi:hypothetical protein
LPPEVQPETGPTKELPPQFRRTLIDYYTMEPAGTIVIATLTLNLYLVLGNGKVSSAMASSKRPALRRLNRIFGSGIARRPNSELVNMWWLGQVPSTLSGFSFSAIHIVEQCGRFGTYRRVRCPFASTISDA